MDGDGMDGDGTDGDGTDLDGGSSVDPTIIGNTTRPDGSDVGDGTPLTSLYEVQLPVPPDGDITGNGR